MKKSKSKSKSRTELILWFVAFALIAYILVTQYIHLQHH